MILQMSQIFFCYILDMNELEEIKKGLLKNGFKKRKDDDNCYDYEAVSYNTININGNIQKQEKKQLLTLQYIGTGGNVEDSDCLDDMFFFDVFQNGVHITTVGVYNFKDLKEILNNK